MGWNTRNFEIDGVVIELPQSIQMHQTYEEFGGVTTHRMMSGASVRQTVWLRLRTRIVVEGFLPPGLEGLDWKSALELKCGLPRAITSTEASIAIPENHRTDPSHLPTGRVLIDGMWRDSQVAVNGNVVTVEDLLDDEGEVIPASAYMVSYYPKFTAYISPPNITYNRTAGMYSWTVEAEEV